MSRRRAAALGAAALLALLVTASIWALPEIARRVAEDQLSEVLGRATRLGRVELNPITGRFAVVGARIAERQGPGAFVAVERIDGRLSWWALARWDIRLREVVARAPWIRVVRTGPDTFNFTDLVDLLSRADPAQKPARFTITVDRFAIDSAVVRIEDQAVAPAADWSIQRLDAEGRGISTDARRPPGALSLRARMGGAAIAATQDVVKLGPVLLVGRVSVTGFDLARLGPYVAADAPAFVEAGRTSLEVNLVWKRQPGSVDTAYVNGEVIAEGLAISQPGRAAPFLTVRRADARIEQADLLAGSITLARLDLAGVEGNAVRDRLGRIDLLLSPEARRLGAEAAATLAAGALPESPEQPAAGGVWRVRVERLGVTEGRVVVDDRAVSPPREWRLDDLAAEGQGLSTVAGDPPGRLTARARWATSPRGGGGRALRGAAGLAFDLTVDREVARPDAPLIAGVLSVDGLAWTRGDRRAPALAVSKASVLIARADPVGREVALADVRVEGIEGGAVRERDGSIDVVTALEAALVPAAPGAPPPGDPAPAAPADQPGADGAWRLRVEQAAVTGTRLVVTDRTVSPPRDFRVDDLSATARAFSTDPADPPAALAVRAQVTSPGADRPAGLQVDAQRVRAAPLEAAGRIRVRGFDLRSLALLLPPELPAGPSRGLVDADLSLDFLEDRARALRAVLGGRMRLTDLALSARGGSAELATVPRLEVAVRKADVLAGTLDLERVELERPAVLATRGADGGVDLWATVQAFQGAAPPASGPAGAPAPAAAARVDPATRPLLAALARALGRSWTVRLDRLALQDGAAEFDDRFITPATRLALGAIALDVQRLTWPTKSPAPFSLSMNMPGGGHTEVKGRLQLDPLDIQLATSTRDAPLEPYQAYFPFPARLSGRLGGDSLNEVQRGPDGALILASRGTAFGENLEARAPGAASPAVRIERFEIRNIDFSWPNYAIVERIAWQRPSASVEREADGSMSLRAMFTPVESGDPGPAEPAAERDWTALIRTGDELGPGRPPRREGPLLETIVLDFEEIAVEDGYLRFLDRSTTPPLSQDLSAFHLSIKGLSNVLGRRPTSLAARGVVDGEGKLELRGEASGIGEALRADLVGELTDFPLASANPYAQATGWIVGDGRLTAKVHYRVEGDQLIGEHDLLLSDLKVEQAREGDLVKQRIGLPLGLIVALLKDTGGDIDFTVPIKASVKDRAIDWEDTYWSALKQAVMKLIVGPFRAIGRAVSGRGDDTIQALSVDPVTFAAGSAVVAPAMETHLTRVGDFLRRSPYLKLALKPVATAADVESVKTQELMARIRDFQRDRRIEEFPAAVRAYMATRGLPDPPPPTVDEQLAALRGVEPEPEARIAELLDRRLAAARSALTEAEGIPAARLSAAPPEIRRDAAEAGRVEFSVDAE